MKNLKVTKNIYGNFRGFETGKQSVELGCQGYRAELWLYEKLQQGGYTVLPKSYFSEADIAKRFSDL